MQPYKTDTWHLLADSDNTNHVLLGYAKLVLGKPCCDMGMSMGTHVRIDAEADIGHFAHSPGNLCNDFQLWNALDIKVLYPNLESKFYLPICLANTSENNLICRKAILQTRLYFTATHTIGSYTCPLYLLKNLRSCTCLDSIMQMPAITPFRFVLYSRQCLSKQSCVIIVEGRTKTIETALHIL